MIHFMECQNICFKKKITKKSFGDRSFWRESIHVVSKCQSQLDNINQKLRTIVMTLKPNIVRLILGIGCITYIDLNFLLYEQPLLWRILLLTIWWND